MLILAYFGKSIKGNKKYIDHLKQFSIITVHCFFDIYQIYV